MYSNINKEGKAEVGGVDCMILIIAQVYIKGIMYKISSKLVQKYGPHANY